MDPEKTKTTATTTLTTATTTVTTSSVKCPTKNQTRHQEHNYTNAAKTGESYQWDESPVGKTTSSTTVTTAAPPSSSSTLSTTVVASSSDSMAETQRATYSGTRSGGVGVGFLSTSQSVQPTSTLLGDRHGLEIRSRVMKKDVFNRIRRSEEELQKAAEMVRGGMTFQTASDTFKIPISTIRFYMARRGILPQRRRGRGSSGARDDDLIHPPFEIIHYRLPDIDRPV